MAEKETFEKTLNKLESIVEELESGALNMDEMLVLFEKGILLTKSCQGQLKAVEDRIQTILKDGDSFIEKSGITNS